MTIDISTLDAKDGTAKLVHLSDCEAAALQLAGDGQDVTLTGAGPVWLYLRLSSL